MVLAVLVSSVLRPRYILYFTFLSSFSFSHFLIIYCLFQMAFSSSEGFVKGPLTLDFGPLRIIIFFTFSFCYFLLFYVSFVWGSFPGICSTFFLNFRSLVICMYAIIPFYSPRFPGVGFRYPTFLQMFLSWSRHSNFIHVFVYQYCLSFNVNESIGFHIIGVNSISITAGSETCNT
ncbi:hypothetical protein L873DRAFT_12211 [Choiromyces venosus 120613-1]|uniref:Uncharacterized protein n=1 Tax=Choiromyces venosus 120613-1 TaxID=1336337 RepID=A0A3N4KC47_9PEZI|nr:hypothetical protein L873DRAFT_12211 [Choiromyces venosus 120613-1]